MSYEYYAPAAGDAALAYDETIPASGLSWPGAGDEQLRFMRHVYERHVARAARARTFVRDLPEGELQTIEGAVRAHRSAAPDAAALLAAARAELTSASPPGASDVGVSSGYRSASTQFASWQRNFPRYYGETAARRAAAAEGEHGDAAADLLARYIGARLGAPGFSLHNSGRAIDLFTVEGGRRLAASTAAENIARWRRSWFWGWLERNAARFNFYQNTTIDEPWHWEHRPPAGTTREDEGDHYREADDETWDAYERLLDEAPLDHEGRALGGAPAEELAELDEAGQATAGRSVVERLPLLSAHAGTPPDLVLRWNDLRASTQVDVVVHLHGYAGRGAAMRIDRDKEPISGLDFDDPDGGPGAGRARPTLGVLPRGHFFGGRSGRGYRFPALVRRGALDELVELSLAEVARQAGVARLERGRLIITAHSGGGAPLMGILAHTDPDEVHVFDGLYGPAGALLEWARRRIERDRALPSGAEGGALRVLYRPGTGTERHSLDLARGLGRALQGAPPTIGARYRVEATREGHNEMVRRFGWRLLADAAAALPGAAQRGPAQAGEQAGPDAAEALPGFSAAEEKALRVTNAFENTGHYVRSGGLSFGSLSGDFDGQGISLGLLQWNIGTGSLQPLLRAFERRHPAGFDAAFGDAAPAVRAMLAQPRERQLAWARSLNDYGNPRRPVVQPAWRERFARLGAAPDFQRIQLQAVRPRMDRAAAYARSYGLRSERGLALMFDIVTQHGPAWPERRDRRETIERLRTAREREQGRPLAEREVMALVAEVIADTVAERWRANVRRRRATIIEGRGRVHGHEFDLGRDFQLGDGPW